ncbi:MAG: CoA transferase, partial [Paracraurococcus sp.]
ELQAIFLTKPTAEWITLLEAEKIGCGPINTLEQVFADPHVIARNMVVEMQHPTGEPVKVIANPVKLSATPPTYRSPPPVLGQHTSEVLGDLLGMSAAEIAGLQEKGIT